MWPAIWRNITQLTVAGSAAMGEAPAVDKRRAEALSLSVYHAGGNTAEWANAVGFLHD